jgi:hypothetical protein
MKKETRDTDEKKVIPRARRDGSEPMISTADRIIPRPSHTNLTETFQRAIEGVFSEEEILQQAPAGEGGA